MKAQRITCPARALTLIAAGCWLGVAGTPIVGAQDLTPSEFPGPLQLAEPARPAKAAGDVYIVQLREAGAASYAGGTAGLAATKPVAGQRFDSSAAAVENYVSYLERSHDSILDSIGSGNKLYSFRYALNGFAAQLTPGQVTRLARREDVINIWRDSDHRLATNNSSLFLGLLDQNGGLRADLGLTGEDVVIAVIDSGVDPTHPALRDFEEEVPRACRSAWAEGSWLGYLLCRPILRDPPTTQVYGPPADFNGICQPGDGFPASSCNNKLVGARFYNEGFLQRNELDENEFLSAKDVDGHGTHIATTVAGNPVTASLFGTRIGEIRGIAPRARVAVYKACWLEPGETRATCSNSDLARAIDDAVADGVDIINYSIGSTETELTAPDDIALLNALDAGVLSVVAAGNDGPANFTIGSPGSAPWVLTVGASTQTGTRYEQAIEITGPEFLSGLVPMQEGSFTAQLVDTGTVEGDLVLVDDGQDVLGEGGAGSFFDACEPLTNSNELAGAIALIERGGCTFQAKLERVEAAGAIGAIIYTLTGTPIVMNGEAGSVGIPAVMIGPADGSDLAEAYLAGDQPTARLEHGSLVDLRETGNQMATFSARGPALSESDFVKPDLTAPGVNILAGSTPDIANGMRGEYFQYLSGTSMAVPMVSGIAALLKEAEPNWSPGTLKSAMMTTAYDEIVTEDGEFLANPFDIGSGHIDGNAALHPGLVYETEFEDYRAFLCGIEPAIVPQTECNALEVFGLSSAAEQLNLPSVGITNLIPGDRITRRVTNIGPPAIYDATVIPPPGMTVSVEPATLSLGTGESAEYRLTFDVQSAPFAFWQFGSVDWTDGTHTVETTIAAQPGLLRAPEEINLSELSGTSQLLVDFGYTGEYTLGVSGLHPPALREPAFVPDDPNNDFSFRFDGGVNAHFFTLGADELFLRVALFDALTDGADDLDLYLYYCPSLSECTEVGQSGSFTSEEEIDVPLPEPGLYTVLVHGFETDETAGGPGANYELLAWSFGPGSDEGNLVVDAPDLVVKGDRDEFDYSWGPRGADTIYLGGLTHDTPFDVFFLTIVTANEP
jgi:subtilisin family serine protease